jgi:hypothetical protein
MVKQRTSVIGEHMAKNKVVVWGTEANDTSGILLTQALDAHFVKYDGDNNEYTDEDKELLKSKNTTIVFFGAVKLPSWLKYDEDRMFNNPDRARELLQKETVIEKYNPASNVFDKYHPLTDKTTYSYLQKKFGNTFNLLNKNSSEAIANIVNETAYLNITEKYPKRTLVARPVTDFTKKYRLFLSSKCPSILGALFTEKRLLTFKESLVINATEESCNHISNLFMEGLLNDDMGTGIVAWTEEKVVSGTDEILKIIKEHVGISSLVEAINNDFSLDFWCMDVIFVPESNNFYVTNILSSPSLQNDAVLRLVAEHCNELIKLGRKMTKEQLIKMASEFNEEQLAKMADIMKQVKVIDCSVT